VGKSPKVSEYVSEETLVGWTMPQKKKGGALPRKKRSLQRTDLFGASYQLVKSKTRSDQGREGFAVCGVVREGGIVAGR